MIKLFKQYNAWISRQPVAIAQAVGLIEGAVILGVIMLLFSFL